MSGDARDFNNIETRAVIKFFHLQGKMPKEVHAILTGTLGEHAPWYATAKTELPKLNVVILQPLRQLVRDDQKQ
jgi:hypothetical protein